MSGAGKGEGYSDLEFAILRELGHPPVPVATTVHDLQVVASVPRDPTDQPLSVIATPTHAIRIKCPSVAPTGIDWTRLTAEDLDEMPILAELKRMASNAQNPTTANSNRLKRWARDENVTVLRDRQTLTLTEHPQGMTTAVAGRRHLHSRALHTADRVVYAGAAGL